MANILLPAAGKSKIQRKLEFSFYNVREVPDHGCEGYGCEDIPEYLYDFKYTDYRNNAGDCQRQNGRHQSMANQRDGSSQYQRNSSCRPCVNNVPNSSGFHQPGKTSIRPGNNNLYGNDSAVNQMGGTREIKTATVPMPNCRPLNCCGKCQVCAMPDDGLWGYSSKDVTNCGWNRVRDVAESRQPDPQVVRPHDRTLPGNTRPTGCHPYFAQESRNCACVPTQAPKAVPTGFNYEKWLATRCEREPPTNLQNKCVASVCTLCGPRIVECCHDFNNVENYLLSKRV